MKLFSSHKINLFKLAAEPAVPDAPIEQLAANPAESPLEGMESFQDIADTVNAGESPEMAPEGLEDMSLPDMPEEPAEDPIELLKTKLISVLGEDDDVTQEEEENLEDATHSITEES